MDSERWLCWMPNCCRPSRTDFLPERVRQECPEPFSIAPRLLFVAGQALGNDPGDTAEPCLLPFIGGQEYTVQFDTHLGVDVFTVGAHESFPNPAFGSCRAPYPNQQMVYDLS